MYIHTCTCIYSHVYLFVSSEYMYMYVPVVAVPAIGLRRETRFLVRRVEPVEGLGIPLPTVTTETMRSMM